MLGISLCFITSALPLRPEKFILLNFLCKNLVKLKLIYIHYYPSQAPLIKKCPLQIIFLEIKLKS